MIPERNKIVCPKPLLFAGQDPRSYSTIELVTERRLCQLRIERITQELERRKEELKERKKIQTETELAYDKYASGWI